MRALSHDFCTRFKVFADAEAQIVDAQVESAESSKATQALPKRLVHRPTLATSISKPVTYPTTTSLICITGAMSV